MHDHEHGTLIIKAPEKVLAKFSKDPKALSSHALSALLETAGLRPLRQDDDIEQYMDDFSFDVRDGYLAIDFLDLPWAELIVKLSHNIKGVEVYAYIDKEYGRFGDLIALDDRGERFYRFAYYNSIDDLESRLGHLIYKEWASLIPRDVKEAFPHFVWRLHKVELQDPVLSVQEKSTDQNIILKMDINTCEFLVEYLTDVWDLYKFRGLWMLDEDDGGLIEIPTLIKELQAMQNSKSHTIELNQTELASLKEAFTNVRPLIAEYKESIFYSECDDHSIDSVKTLVEEIVERYRDRAPRAMSTELDRLRKCPDLVEYFIYLFQHHESIGDIEPALSSLKDFLHLNTTPDDEESRYEQLSKINILEEYCEYRLERCSEWKLLPGTAIYQQCLLIAVNSMHRCNKHDDDIELAIWTYGNDVLQRALDAF